MMKSTPRAMAITPAASSGAGAFMQGDLDQFLQARQRPCAVVLAPRLRHMR